MDLGNTPKSKPSTLKTLQSRPSFGAKTDETYHQLELCEESRHLTIIYGTRGRMRYKRLNYGGQSAQDIFDKAMGNTIHGLDGVLHTEIPLIWV